MKKRFVILLVVILLAGALLLLCFLLSACSEESAEEAEATLISIWCVEGDGMYGELASLAEQFNLSTDDPQVELKAYASEAELAQALDSARPDMILCGHERAFALYEQERLRDVSSQFADAAPVFCDSFQNRSGCIGASFFPIGAETELLVVNEAELEKIAPVTGGQEVFSSLESICDAASVCGQDGGRIFFTADSFTTLFAAGLANSGAPFSGIRLEDLQNAAYKGLYNLLANAAYNGGLAGFDSPALPLVESGEVVCAFISSTDLTGSLAEGLKLYPTSSGGDGGGTCFARAVGLAVTSPFSGHEEAVAQFLTWLCQPERAVPLALSQGLIPAVQGSLPKDAGSLATLLFEQSSAAELYLPAIDSGYFRNREEFEQSFRAALAMLG